jgi:hypothetical protein
MTEHTVEDWQAAIERADDRLLAWQRRAVTAEAALDAAREENDRLRDALACILPYAESPDFDNGPPEDPENTYRDAMAKSQAALGEGER